MATIIRKTYYESEKKSISLKYTQCHYGTGYLKRDCILNKHDFYEIVFCKNADAQYVIGKKRYLVSKGDIIFIPMNMNHFLISNESLANYFDFIILWISPKFLQNISELYTETGVSSFPLDKPFILHTADVKEFDFGKEFCSLYQESLNSSPYLEAYMYSSVSRLFTNFVCCYNQYKKIDSLEPPNLIGEIISYVDDNFLQKINLSDTATYFHISKSSLTKLFQEELNISFYRFVTQRRLIEGKNLIKNGIPLKSIPSQIGFNDYSSFYRAFKKEYNMTPTEYAAFIKEQSQFS